MCLASIRKEAPKKSGVGYKVFKKRSLKGERLYGIAYSKGKGYFRKRWYSAGKGNIGLRRNTYPQGFHIFLYRSAAERMTREWGYLGCEEICKVKYREAHTLGKQRGMVVVAREMYIF